MNTKVLRILPVVLAAQILASCNALSPTSSSRDSDEEAWHNCLNWLKDGECRIDIIQKDNTRFTPSVTYESNPVVSLQKMKVVINGIIDCAAQQDDYIYVFSGWSNGPDNMNMNVVKVSPELISYRLRTFSSDKLSNARKFYISLSNDLTYGWTRGLNDKMDEQFALWSINCPVIE
ncbi:MAG: hypothetical protein E7182_03590 [Erysipelotrichaceae bacterium]|nr:hypothetical protein [Erysipelotrichaceae bacterium]